MKLIGYIRVSSEGQVDGYGPETQERAIRTWASAHGHSVDRVVSDLGVSGQPTPSTVPDYPRSCTRLRKVGRRAS